MIDEGDEEEEKGLEAVYDDVNSSSRKSLRETSSVESTASQNDLNNLLGDEDSGNDEEMDGTEGLEESGMEESNNNTMSVKGGEKHRAEASFVESTASQNDLNNLLDAEDENMDAATEDVGERQAPSKIAVESPAGAQGENQVAESTPVTTQTNTAGLSSNNSMLPSPSFSGKKQRGSGIVMMRKSLGGDATKIRQLTASLRKRKKDKKSRMSLPAFSMGMQHQQLSGVADASSDRTGESEAGVQRNEPAASPSINVANSSPLAMMSPSKKVAAKSPSSMDVDSPARGTHVPRGSHLLARAPQLPRILQPETHAATRIRPLPPSTHPQEIHEVPKRGHPCLQPAFLQREIREARPRASHHLII